MAPNQRFYSHSNRGSRDAPADEMLAVDAATELRSLTLLYDRYADRLYRYFLAATCDPQAADRLMRNFVAHLPTALQGYDTQERSFAGWLFQQASRLVWQEHTFLNRLQRRISHFAPNLPFLGRERSASSVDSPPAGAPNDFDDFSQVLAQVPPAEREVIALSAGAGLGTLPLGEALRLPASLVSSHVDRALRALGQHLGTDNTRRISEMAREIISHQQLSAEQRRGHLGLMHGLMHGEVDTDSVAEERGPLLEIMTLALVVLVGLAGIWLWGQLAPGDTRQHEAQPVAIGSDTESDRDAEAADDEAVTITPAETETPGSDVEVAADATETTEPCSATESKAKFDQFVHLYNNGNIERLGLMLPEDDYDDPFSQDEQESDTGPREFFVHRDARFSDSDDVLNYLVDRYEAGERWDVIGAYPAEHFRQWQGAAPLDMYQEWKHEHPGYGMVVVSALDWGSGGGGTEIASGRVIVDCDRELIIDWDLSWDESQNSEPVAYGEFMNVMGELQPGEVREISARARTDARNDGGGLLTWELTWSEAVLDDGTEVERVIVRMLNGGQIINYVHDGEHWRLEQRAWVMRGGGDDPALPDEISMVVPWLRLLPEVLADNETLDTGNPVTIRSDRRFDDGLERWLEVEIVSGEIDRIQVVESTSNGEQIKPEITLTGVSRSSEFEPETFEIGMDPGSSELAVHEPRFEVPDRDVPHLSVLSMSIGGDQTRENYRLRWNNVEIDLTVRPSRGGVDLLSVPSLVDDSWSTAAADYEFGTLIWAHRQFSGYPTNAMWDDGVYRFEAAIDRDRMSPEHEWNLNQLRSMANTLSSASDRPKLVHDRARGRQANWLPTGAFNH